MDRNNASNEENYSIDWNTDDELEIQNYRSSSSSFPSPHEEVNVGNGERCSSSGSSNSRLIDYFKGMGFAEKLVLKAIQENGEEDNSELILETLLTYTAVENSPEQQQNVNSDQCSSGYDEGILDDFSDSDSWFGSEEKTDSLSDRDRKLLTLVNMGYTVNAASTAMDRCGPEASLDELTDCIFAAETAKAADIDFPDESKLENISNSKKRKLDEYLKKKKRLPEDEETIRLPNPMIGFGVPTADCPVIHRNLPVDAVGPPYFYYENIALTPKGVWDTISRFLYGIQPEFVDSKFFCAAARKRGYVHNLPIDNRFPLLPLPPRTIHEALPLTRKWWPSWDTRKQLNCLQTSITSAKKTERIRKALEICDGDPPLSVQKFVFEQCRKWNLVWVGRNKVAPLECDEVEMLLGFPKNHTRGGGVSRTDRYKSLGNSFQVDTVAYHLSPLKDLYPSGINLLSLFSGIGGAEVALHRLGIRLKNVVSVEISEVNRNIVRCWWDQTNQKGNLTDSPDIQQLNGDKLEELMTSFGGFDLIVGGSPCNNLSGGNRVSREGLEGEQSSLFFDYFRVLDLVKIIMGNKQQ